MPLFLQDALAALARLSPWRGGLSARLLALTAAFVLVAEILIFFPSASAFRRAWLMERIEAAQLASLALEASPDLMVPEVLARELLANAGVEAVALKRDGERQLILSTPMGADMPVMVDLRRLGFWGGIMEACATFLTPEGRRLRIVAEPRLGGGEFIEAVVAEAPLKSALYAYSRRIAALSLLIAAMTGALLYYALTLVLVRPMRALALAMMRFSEAPDDEARIITPSGRRDEIGQAEVELASLQSQVRAALKQRERLAALGEAVAKINHDLRNILTTAQLISDRLAASPDPKTAQSAQRLVRSIDRGVRLAEEVLRYGRAETPEPQPQKIVLAPALDEAFADAVAPLGVDIAWRNRLDPKLVILADPEHVHRIFLNLIRNAGQAMAARADPPAPPAIEAMALMEGGVVKVVLADTGPGVPDKVRATLFRAFSTSGRAGGSGLGLAIARELAMANGGALDLDRSDATGASFAVRLPGEGA